MIRKSHSLFVVQFCVPEESVGSAHWLGNLMRSGDVFESRGERRLHDGLLGHIELDYRGSGFAPSAACRLEDTRSPPEIGPPLKRRELHHGPTFVPIVKCREYPPPAP